MLSSHGGYNGTCKDVFVPCMIGFNLSFRYLKSQIYTMIMKRQSNHYGNNCNKTNNFEFRYTYFLFNNHYQQIISVSPHMHNSFYLFPTSSATILQAHTWISNKRENSLVHCVVPSWDGLQEWGSWNPCLLNKRNTRNEYFMPF